MFNRSTLKKQNKRFEIFDLTCSPAPQRQNELTRKHPSPLSDDEVQICLNLHHCPNTFAGETKSSASCHQVYLNYKLLKNIFLSETSSASIYSVNRQQQMQR